MVQSKDGALGDRLVIGGVFLSVVGTILSIVGLTMGYWPSLAGIVLSNVIGYWLNSVGTHKSGHSFWAAIKELTLATERVAEEWTPSKLVPIHEFVPATASFISMRYKLEAKKLNIPLKIRVSTEPDGYGLSAEGSGESGELELMLGDSMQIYCSVSHPSIIWTLSCKGWQLNH